MAGALESMLRLLHPHYVGNLLLSVCFYLLKITPPICLMLFDDCELELVSSDPNVTHYRPHPSSTSSIKIVHGIYTGNVFYMDVIACTVQLFSRQVTPKPVAVDCRPG